MNRHTIFVMLHMSRDGGEQEHPKDGTAQDGEVDVETLGDIGDGAIHDNEQTPKKHANSTPREKEPLEFTTDKEKRMHHPCMAVNRFCQHLTRNKGGGVVLRHSVLSQMQC